MRHSFFGKKGTKDFLVATHVVAMTSIKLKQKEVFLWIIFT